MIGAGTFLSPLIKVVTTVAILAAIYFFIVKPVLETTENVSNNVSDSFQGFGEIEGFNQVAPQTQQDLRKAEKIQEDIQSSSQAQIEEANKLLNCIGEASGDVAAIERCNQKFDPANP